MIRFPVSHTSYILGSIFIYFSCNILSESENNVKDKFTEFSLSKTGVNLEKIDFKEGLPIYNLLPFKEENRNHYDDRPEGTNIDTLIMHYTVADYERTMKLFTDDKPKGNVSSHYVITQKESDNIHGGGK